MTAITAAQAKQLYKQDQVIHALANRYGPGFYRCMENFDATTGAINVTVADTVAGTNATAFTVGISTGTTPRISIAENTAKTGDYILTIKPGTLGASRTVLFPDSIGANDVIVTEGMAQTLVSKTLTAPTIADFTNATHDHSTTAKGGTLTLAAISGTTNNTFDVDSDNLTGVLRLQTTTGGTNSTVTLTNTTTTADVTVTLPNVAGTLAVLNASQKGPAAVSAYLTLAGATSGSIKIAAIDTGTNETSIVNQAGGSAKVITLPAITCTLAGLGLDNAFTGANVFSGVNTFASITGNDASLGIAGTAGTGAGAGGIVAIVGGLGHTNAAGGAITVIGGGGAGTGAGGATTLKGGDSGTGSTGNGGAATVQGGAATSTAGTGGAVYLTGGLGTTDGAGGAITIVGGAGGITGNGGAITITSGASGGASDTAGAVAIDSGAATGGTAGAITIGATNAASIGIGHVGGYTNTVSGLTVLTETDSGTTTSTKVLTINHAGGTPDVGLGTAISIGIEDAGGVEEQGLMDFKLAVVTNGSEDCDFILSLNLNGTITQAFKIDSVNQKAVIGVASDADSIASLQIFPASGTAKGSLILTATAHASADYSTTIQSASDGAAAAVLTLPNATCTMSGIGLAETFSAVKTFTAVPVIQITDVATNSVVDVATIKLIGGTPANGLGLGLSFIVENDTDTTTQVASIDIVNTEVTKGTLDTDTLFSNMLAGTVTETLRIDASDQSVTVGRNATDTNGINKLRIYPLTTGSGSLILQAAVDASGDHATTITNATDAAGAVTVTLPNATSTIAALGIAQTWTATQTIRALTASAGAYDLNFGASTGAFTTSSGANTLSGDVTISGSKTFATGTGAVSINGVTTFGNTTGIIMSGTITTGINLTGTISDGIRFNPVYVGQAIVIDGGTATDTGTIGTAIQIGLTGTKLTLTTADQSAIKAYVTTSASSGDNRLCYLNYTVSAAGGGECLRALTNLTAASGTVRGAHISLVPSGSGAVSGQGAALCATLHFSDAGLTTGWLGALQAQIYPEAGDTNGNIATNHGLLWLDVVSGVDDTQAAKILNAMLITTASTNIGNKAAALMISNADVTGSGGASAGGIAINVNGTRMWLATYTI